jgi:3-hydroxyisobutyrate dehydrogenase-like beta-hydroxyacid dehydrogenase
VLDEVLRRVRDGATMKLAVNAVVHGSNQALSEALVLAERAGVDRATAYEVFAAGTVAAPLVHYKRNSFVDPGDPGGVHARAGGQGPGPDRGLGQ